MTESLKQAHNFAQGMGRLRAYMIEETKVFVTDDSTVVVEILKVIPNSELEYLEGLGWIVGNGRTNEGVQFGSATFDLEYVPL